MKLTLPALACCCALMLNGCAMLQLGVDMESPDFTVESPDAYATISDIPNFNGSIATASILGGGDSTGRLLHLSLWPLGQVELGVLGAQAKILMLDAGFGALWYVPQPTEVEDGILMSGE